MSTITKVETAAVVRKVEIVRSVDTGANRLLVSAYTVDASGAIVRSFEAFDLPLNATQQSRVDALLAFVQSWVDARLAE